MKLRSNWHQIYRQALAILKSHLHPIAQTTYAIIQGKEVHVFPFSQVNAKDYNSLVKGKYKKIPAEFPLSSRAINHLSNEYDGFIYGKRVYVNCLIKDPRKFASVLVHEVNHFMNNSNSHCHDDAQKFTEEFRAEVAEALVFSPNFTRSKIKDIAHMVAKDYELPLPTEPIKMPPGIFTRR